MNSLKKLFNIKNLCNIAMFIFGLVVMYTIFQLLFSFREGVKIKARPSDKSMPMSKWELTWDDKEDKGKWEWLEWGGKKAKMKAQKKFGEDATPPEDKKSIDWVGDLKSGKKAGGMIIANNYVNILDDEIKRKKQLQNIKEAKKLKRKVKKLSKNG